MNIRHYRNLLGLCLLTGIIHVNVHSSGVVGSCYQLLFAGTTQSKDDVTVVHIYVTNPDGTGQKPLTDGDVFDSNARWSPDGTHIVFVRRMIYVDDQNPHVFIMQPDGSNARRLTDEKLVEETYPIWSPDSKAVAFIGVENDTLGVYVINTDGTNLTRLLILEGTAKDFPSDFDSYLPRPDMLAFSHDSRYLHVVWGDLMTIDLVDKSITTLPFHGEYPEWSPDGKRIIYVNGREGMTDIYVMDADGGNVKALTNTGEEVFPTWSPDGHIIAFTSNRNGDSDFLTHDVYLMAADGSHLTRMTTDAMDYWRPIWSPDGKQLVFWSNISQQTYIIDSDKQRFHAVTHFDTSNTDQSGLSYAAQFSWSPSLCH